MALAQFFCSGTPLRPKAARVEPHTHTKRHAGNFLWSWPAEWLAGACAVRPYVAFHVHRSPCRPATFLIRSLKLLAVAYSVNKVFKINTR